ncbi:uncharacterized protein FFUJ_13342 [Fusarium fujikuroi IMI 58289]|uniref:Uncharacterized protein n=1 Tax=Gibberella fujikuroi (strain CBS 195.34 / IMI 58289 / NRRL A-6831) TaxID=1279085 RepID=S0DX57_GIBF5|nr:uncharacterized protein FFUJ_13342 [Fusarium fujikuroi IMI 58289]KLO98822.1 uncharacterized protein LW94_12002 [Fusarium fujikuroi]CCT67154.1 uncharacterized protein FFUJ_13342 [Fusarium fujikuroi IMI 58289]SCN96198.1 uncharacterized protein FFM5_06343 [Fusarium fujikuroi]SCO41065.1 uncharacterized protein FFMR_06100 [Fusarium fujikuroi]
MSRRRPRKRKNPNAMVNHKETPTEKEISTSNRGRPRITGSVSHRLSQSNRDKRTSTLCVPKGDEILSFPVNEDRMNRVCPPWRQFKLLGGRKRLADTNGMDFENERAKEALRIVSDIVHGKEAVDYENSSPRLLFYILEVHAWLGHPKATYSCGMDPKMVGTQGAKFSPFFHRDAISKCIFDMARKAKYLYRVRDWLLLALVAEKLRLHDAMQLVLDNLCLFCKAYKRELPEEARDCIKDRDWARLQDLRLTDKALLEKREFYVEVIFEGLRLLSHQLLYFDGGILLNEKIFKTYQDYKVAACSYCRSLSSDEFHRELISAHLWPLCADAYKERVIDLLYVIRDMEERTLVGRHCNQLTHLYDHLRRMCTEQER